MASQENTPVIITPRGIEEGRRIGRQLEKEPLLSVDSEGVNLGKDGPLMLLQIGTLDGSVYLFDVMKDEKTQDKMFLKRTGIDKILSSTEIVKVIHSCSGDSAALYHQFGIRLQNVFDTQVAHVVIEEHKGKLLPIRLKLAEMCEKYSEHADVYKKKDDIKMIWSKLVGNFWAIRPMTDEMILYASSDVTALIPEVYKTQKRYIEENGIDGIYKDRVLEEIELDIESTQKQNRIDRHNKVREVVLTKMDEKYADHVSVKFEDLTDPDERKAVEDSRLSEIECFSDKIKELKQEAMALYLTKLEQELKDTDQFNPERSTWYKLGEIERFGRGNLKALASTLREQLVIMVVDDLNKKYTLATDVSCLSSLERSILNSIQPLGKDKGKISATVVHLHFKLVESNLDMDIEKLDEDPNYEIYVSLGKLYFFIKNGEVPKRVKEKAATLKEKVHKTTLDSIPRKYTKATGVDELTRTEKEVLKDLQVGRNRYHPPIVELHWKVTYENLCEDFEQLKTGKRRMNDGFRRKLNFLKSNSQVPRDLKEKAKEVLSSYP